MHRAYDEREAALGSEVMRELERRVLLCVLDRKWREHLYEMDYLRAGIHLRAMANRDPVVEYQREGFDMFNAMLDGIKEESVGFLFNLEVKTKEEQEAEAAGQAGRGRGRRARRRPGGDGAGAGPPGGGGRRGAGAAPAGPARRPPPGKAPRPAGRCADGRGAEAVGHRAAAGGQGPGRSRGSPENLQYSAPTPGRLGEGGRRRQGGQDRDGDRLEGAGAQRALPLRLGQEVQVLPRSGRIGV